MGWENDIIQADSDLQDASEAIQHVARFMSEVIQDRDGDVPQFMKVRLAWLEGIHNQIEAIRAEPDWKEDVRRANKYLDQLADQADATSY